MQIRWSNFQPSQKQVPIHGRKGKDCLINYGNSMDQTKTFSNKYVGTYHLEGAVAVVQAKEVNRGHQIVSPDLVLSFPKPGKICNKH